VNREQSQRIAVIGAGAAGLFGAIACAEANPNAEVQVLEAGREPLTKVRISGGGRCNVTHACFDPALLVTHYPRGGRALRGAFSRFQPKDTVAWFQRRGVPLKTEADGRMFPTTDDSGTIIDCLLGEAHRLGIQIHTATPVRAIGHHPSEFQLFTRGQAQNSDSPDNGQERYPFLVADRILLATGSSPAGFRLATSLGHKIVPPVPSLFTFNVRDHALQELAGVSVEPVELTLKLQGEKPLKQTGPLLVTHWGLSGPAVLKLSAYGAVGLHRQHYQAELRVNWLPSLSQEGIRSQLLQAKQEQGKRLVFKHCPLPLPRRLWHYLGQHRVGLKADLTWANLPKSGLQNLVLELNQGKYAITGKGVFKEEFVTCGGIRLRDVDFKTMESRLCPGLHFAGEVLDIDGITGGFNFQNAWTTGWLAGRAIARNLTERKTSALGQTQGLARNRQSGSRR
jgi:predicted Rossmann fold flavoprotein